MKIKCKVEILEADNLNLIDIGVIRIGDQVCKVRFLSGSFKGQSFERWNMLSKVLFTIQAFSSLEIRRKGSAN